jgi:hypothetical protein
MVLAGTWGCAAQVLGVRCITRGDRPAPLHGVVEGVARGSFARVGSGACVVEAGGAW